MSRRFGGIHPYYDDYPSRIAGSRIGSKAWEKARELYGPGTVTLCHAPAGARRAETIEVGAASVDAHLAHGDCVLDDGVPCTIDRCDEELLGAIDQIREILDTGLHRDETTKALGF